jgi:hypothetical protein
VKPPPPSKRRASREAKVVLVVLAVLLGAGVAYKAWDENRTWGAEEMADLERSVAHNIENEADIDCVTITCPSEVKWKPGEMFSCFARAGGDRAQVEVHMEEEGEYIWETFN